MAEKISDDALARAGNIVRLLGVATRMAIIHCLLAGGEASVGRVAAATGRGQPSVSKHLKLLSGVGIPARLKEGLQVFHRLSEPVVGQVCRLVVRLVLKATNG